MMNRNIDINIKAKAISKKIMIYHDYYYKMLIELVSNWIISKKWAKKLGNKFMDDCNIWWNQHFFFDE